ncbi:MAG TPA: CPBP family intramembrane glutamic endopeptidase [Gemmatimonadaceae bacterium]
MILRDAGAVRAHDAAAKLRGFGPLGLLAIVGIFAGSMAGPPVGALLVLLWAKLSETPRNALGFAAPRNPTATLVGGVAFGIVFKLVMKALVMPLLGAPPVNARYHYLAGDSAALPGAIVAVLLGAAFGEEVFFRCYLFERLGALLGRGRAALTVTVLTTAVLFAVAHYRDQGVPGVEQAAVTGLVFGGIFAWRRRIWFVMIAHAAFDLAAVALIYWSWEGRVAQLFLR